MNDDPSRRRFLSVVAGAAATAGAGCLGRRGDALAMGDRAGGVRMVTVSNPRLQRTYVYDNSAWREVKGRHDAQYLLVDVETWEFDRAPVSAFDVAVDGERLDAEGHAATGDAEVADGPVAFPVPVGPAEQAAVVWTRTLRSDVRWRVPADVVARFARAPEFRVRDVTFTAEDGLRVAVENVGDRDGTFRLRISSPHAYDISHLSTWDVPAGETVTHRVPTEDLHFVDPADGVDFELSWGTGAADRSFEG